MSDDEFDSTTENVRDCFVYGRWFNGNPERHFAEFDQWLAAHDVEIARQSPASTTAADAWDEGAIAASDDGHDGLEFAQRTVLPNNPYRGSRKE